MEPLLKRLGLVIRLNRVTQLTDNGRNLVLVRFEDKRSLKRYRGLVGKAGATTFHLSSAWVVVHLLPIGRQRGYAKEIKASTVGEWLGTSAVLDTRSLVSGSRSSRGWRAQA